MEQENVSNVENSTENVDTQTTEQNEVKTFTQEEVNTMIQERLAKEKKKMPSKEELEAYNNWKESQKTEAEKNAEVLQENTQLKTRISELENMQTVSKAGVDPKFVKFVSSEVSKEGVFEDNLKEYLESNPQYLQQTETPKTTGFSQKNVSQVKSEEQAYLDSKYAKNPYYKQK